jgi:hypothetical protein
MAARSPDAHMAVREALEDVLLHLEQHRTDAVAALKACPDIQSMSYAVCGGRLSGLVEAAALVRVMVEAYAARA